LIKLNSTDQAWLSREALEKLDTLIIGKGYHHITRVNNSYYLDGERFHIDNFEYFDGTIDEIEVKKTVT